MESVSYFSLAEVSRRKNEGRTLYLKFEETTLVIHPFYVWLCIYLVCVVLGKTIWFHLHIHMVSHTGCQPHLGILHSVIPCWLDGWCPKVEMS